MDFHRWSQTKHLSIPDHVPVGAVIGKGGSYCKALRDHHNVRCSVDCHDREVTLIGPENGIKNAEDELTHLFTSFAISKPVEKRVFEVFVQNGPLYWWSFKKTKERTSDEQVQKYQYRLQQSGRAAETESITDSWVQDFRQDDIRNVMKYLQLSGSEPKIRIAFGSLCFKLLSFRCENSAIGWPELQKFRQHKDFQTRWSNYCNRRSSSSIANLMDTLEQWMEKGEEPQKYMSVHLAGYQGISYDLKYHLEKGQWNLHQSYSRRYVCGTYDVVLENDASLRIRAVTREKISHDEAADIQRHLHISTSDDGNIFDTKVMLRETAPPEMHVKAFGVKLKVHVKTNGVYFSLMYVDQRLDEFRLECRLAREEKEKLSGQDNEAEVLLEKVLRYYRAVEEKRLG
ncbi:K Homology domain, type 1 [Plasmopara halstedii]|uniref:K Homology domain, type 1 n=1 Tax=Plasmopara halstedii TaxID=4781 RepID=A0A0P1AFW8_PLAHL|nr:K Homology domain, type 1 [Plasmopara halstedii]CEG39332.1 K Homology domain, type 1 [Plasmopara halstedii]|eukprot:XP_024575701.1 K Homology domain, type 1 [Plasmopara halstedii]